LSYISAAAGQKKTARLIDGCGQENNRHGPVVFCEHGLDKNPEGVSRTVNQGQRDKGAENHIPTPKDKPCSMDTHWPGKKDLTIFRHDLNFIECTVLGSQGAISHPEKQFCLSHIGINKRKIWNCGAVKIGWDGFV